MRSLRRVVEARPRRQALAAVVVIAGAACSAAGCAQFDASLGQQQAVISFRPGTSQATMMTVRSACGKVPGATPLAIPHGANATNGAYDVRFNVRTASDADIAKLEQCLQKYPSVQGINIEQQGGD